MAQVVDDIKSDKPKVKKLGKMKLKKAANKITSKPKIKIRRPKIKIKTSSKDDD